MNAAAVLAILASGTALIALGVAAVGDVRRRIIADEAVVVVAGAGLVLRILDFDIAGLAISLLTALGLLVALGQLSRFDIVGGGDAKLIAAASLVQSARSVPLLLILIALCGGLLALAYLARAGAVSLHARLANRPAGQGRAAQVIAMSSLRSISLPYGVAILSGTLILNAFEVFLQCSTVASCWS